MNDEQTALSRRAVACKGWRWMPGAAGVLPDARHIRVANDHAPYWGGAGLRLGNNVSRDALPDLTDAATIGCLLALVREAWGDPGFYVTRSGIYIKDTDILGWDSFGILRGRGWGTFYRSEVEALVAALEGAP